MAGTIIADKWQNGNGSENFKCRAWVNFNGAGSVAIRASGNVSSITDFGTGLFGVNLTTALPDSSGSATGSAAMDLNAHPGNGTPNILPVVLASTTHARIGTSHTGGVADVAHISVVIFR